MNRLSRLSLAALVSGGVLLLASPSYAQLTTFANVLTGGSALKFTNNGASSTFGTTSGVAIPVTFRYFFANGTGLTNVDIPATMTLTGLVTGGAGGFSQKIDQLNMAITSNALFGGQNNLLSMSLSSGTLGKNSLSTASLSGTQGGGGLDTVTYTSSFLNFSAVVQTDFSFTMTAIAPLLSALSGNGYMNTWTGTGTGNFSSDPVPASTSAPEPGTLTLAAVGLFGLALRRRGLRQ